MNMIQLISKCMKQFRLLCCCLIAAIMVSCEKPIQGHEDDGNVRLTFAPSVQDVTTRGTVTVGDFFQKMNIQLFDASGNKVFDKVRTQTRDDDDFGVMSLQLKPGAYTVISVGHSSTVSANIKSTEMVQFTASDGEKLTDTFCYFGQVTVGDEPAEYTLTMHRVDAMFRLVMTDEEVPPTVAKIKLDYSGGSANFNPTTFEGCTKSSQSETRTVSPSKQYVAFTFPYMATSCNLRMTITALTEDGTAIHSRVLEDVPVTRNRITTYTGQYFVGDGPWTVTQTDFGFTVNADWDGEDHYTF